MVRVELFPVLTVNSYNPPTNKAMANPNIDGRRTSQWKVYGAGARFGSGLSDPIDFI